MLLTPDLTAAIETLYRVFRRYELRSTTDPCPCCHTPQDEVCLHHKPLHKLSGRDLQQYAMDAIYTWGSGDDFKHFLPRLFELLATNGDEFYDAAGVFSRLTYESASSTHWRTWSKDEQGAVLHYLQAVWEAALNSNPEDLPFDGAHSWIEAIAQAEHDLSKYLHQWLEAESPNAHRNLASMIVNERLPNAQSPGGGYWAGHREQWEQLNDWLRRPEVKAKLSNAVDRWSEEAFANEFVDAAVLLPLRECFRLLPTDRPESSNHAQFRSVQPVNSVPHVSCAAELLGYNQL